MVKIRAAPVMLSQVSIVKMKVTTSSPFTLQHSKVDYFPYMVAGITLVVFKSMPLNLKLGSFDKINYEYFIAVLIH